MNLIFPLMFFIAFVVAAQKELFVAQGVMQALSEAMLASAKQSVSLAIGLVGVMALFLGLMKIAEKGGLLTILARLLQPLLIRLFPDIPASHPAMGAIIMNFSANALGLGNAATPFGIRAMEWLDRLNTQKGTATDAMILFLAINTSSLTLLPTGVIALRASLGSANPAGILPTTLFASCCATITAIVVAKICARFSHASHPALSAADGLEEHAPITQGYPLWVSLLTLLGVVGFVILTVLFGQIIAPWIIPVLAITLLVFGACKGVPLYEGFIEGAKESFEIALRMIPYLVAILVGVAMLRASGALDLLIAPLARWSAPLGLPAEALPMALLRPLSGSGAYGLMASILADPAIGPDSYVGYLVSTLQGSTETTFYVLAVYFGAIGVKKVRYMLIPALLADLAGIAGAVMACQLLYGG
jgi:spore maturation protein SpmA